MRGELTGVEGRKIFTNGWLYATEADGTERLCAEAEGLFISIDFGRFAALKAPAGAGGARPPLGHRRRELTGRARAAAGNPCLHPPRSDARLRRWNHLEVARAIHAAISIAAALELHAEDADGSPELEQARAAGACPATSSPESHQWGTSTQRSRSSWLDGSPRPGAPWLLWTARVEPRGYERDGFEVTLWTYYEPVTPEVAPAAYADALERLHAGMRRLDVPTPHFTDRVRGSRAARHES